MKEKTLSILKALEKMNEWFLTFEALDSDNKFYYKIHRRPYCYGPEWYLELDFLNKEFYLLNEHWYCEEDGRRVKKDDEFPITFTNFEIEHFDEELFEEFLNKAEYLILHWDTYKQRILNEYNKQKETDKEIFSIINSFEA